MKPLHHPDSLYLQAAVGWLELGNWSEANEELESITPTMRAHPEVLKLRVAIYCKARRFDMAAPVSDTLANSVPDDAQFWFNRAVALCQLGRMQEARAALVITFELQPKLRLTALDNPDLTPLWANLPV